MKVGATRPYVQAQLLNPDGTGKDLVGINVTFKMRLGPTSPYKVDAAAVKLVEANGIVEYRWVAGNTDTEGAFRCEFHCSDGEVHPLDGFIIIEFIE